MLLLYKADGEIPEADNKKGVKTMDREKTLKAMKYYGILFIFLAIWDVGTLVLRYFEGEFSYSYIRSQAGDLTTSITDQLITTSIVVVVVIVAILFVMELFVGIRGLQIAGGSTNYKGAAPVSKVLLVLNIIALIGFAMDWFKNKSDSTDFFSTLATVIILFGYLNGLKTLKEEV